MVKFKLCKRKQFIFSSGKHIWNAIFTGEMENLIFRCVWVFNCSLASVVEECEVCLILDTAHSLSLDIWKIKLVSLSSF